MIRRGTEARQLAPARPGASGPVLTKREANKLDKLRRIQQAAHELFVNNGYDSTTMREIATRAEVALGTLFLYATNKRDLLFLIANDLMEDAVDEAASLVGDGNGLGRNVTLVAGVHFRSFGSKPELFRLVLRELLFYDSGEQGVRAVKNRARLLALIRRIVGSAVRRGEIGADVDPEQAARLLFAILQAEIRTWIATEARELEIGVASFWSAVALLMNGLGSGSTLGRATRPEIRAIMARLLPSDATGDRRRRSPARGASR